ncbi:LysE family translocator [Streptomyces sp. NPDC007088]|uniref:LysE family translocator n=1 Tax=Streptomyces sp. NPDC007088 TaxID=3364773 RepID=UPI0036C70C1A
MSVDLVGFLGVVLVAYVVPGPDFLVVLRSAAENPAKGRAAALGAQSGLCVHMLAAALGLSVIAARSPVVYDAIKFCGAAYLVYLGVRAVLAARRSARLRETAGTERKSAAVRGSGAGDRSLHRSETSAAEGENEEESGLTGDAGKPANGGRWAGFTQGFLTNVLNPKAALFFLSILPQFINGSGSMTRQIFFLGILDVLIGVVYWFALVLIATQLRALLARPSVRRRWELTTGWLFIAIGVAVATVA